MNSGTVTDTLHRTETSIYNDHGRLSQVSNDEGIPVYEYDDLGRKTRTIVFSPGADTASDTPERTTSYEYDALGRLQTVTDDLDPASTDDDPLAAHYAYDLPGNLSRTDLPNGVVARYDYDASFRLDLLTVTWRAAWLRANAYDGQRIIAPRCLLFRSGMLADGRQNVVDS